MWLDENGHRIEEVFVGDGIEYKEKLWCVCNDFEGLYCIDIKNLQVEKRVIFNMEGEVRRPAFNKVLLISGHLYLIPLFSEYIIIYHIEDGETEYINLKRAHVKTDVHKGMYVSGCCYKQYLFLFPYNNQNILRFDTEKKKIDFLEWPNNEKNKKAFIRRCCVLGKYIWIAEDKGNRILCINAEKMQSKWINLSKEIYLQDLCLWRNELFCLDETGKIIVIDIKTERSLLLDNLKNRNYGFIEKSENFIWLIPKGSDSIVRYSEEKRMEAIEYPYDFEFSPRILAYKLRTFSHLYTDSSKMIIMPRCNNKLVWINKINDEISFNSLIYAENLKSEIKKQFRKNMKEGIVIEEIDGTLNWFVKSLLEEESMEALKKNREPFGDIIYQKILR